MADVDRKNAYWCDDCQRYTVTVDVDEGVTPMFLACRAAGYEPGDTRNPCKGRSRSMMYPPPGTWPQHPDLDAGSTWEWYAPDTTERTRLYVQEPETFEHVQQGGLLLRRRGEGEAPTEPQPARRPRVGRNDPCPCGSGRKFKRCCGG